MKKYALCLVTMFLMNAVQAATWLKAENGQWLYVDAYLPIELFEMDTLIENERIIHGLSMPLSTTDTSMSVTFELQGKESGSELWYKKDGVSFKVMSLSTEGVTYFEPNQVTIGFLGRRIKYFIKEVPNGMLELWDAEMNELIIEVTAEGAEKLRKNPESLIMTIDNR